MIEKLLPWIFAACATAAWFLLAGNVDSVAMLAIMIVPVSLAIFIGVMFWLFLLAIAFEGRLPLKLKPRTAGPATFRSVSVQ